MEELTEQCRKKSDDVERYRNDINAQAEQLAAAQTKIRDLQVSYSELQNAQLPLQFDLTRAVHDRDSLTSRVAWLENELSSKSSEHYKTRHALTSQIQELEAALKDAQAEIKNHEAMKQDLQAQLAHHQETISEHSATITQLNATLTSQRSEHNREVDAQKQLLALYKKNFDDAVEKIGELEASVTSYQNTLSKQAQQHQNKLTELEQKSQEMVQKLEEEHKLKCRELEEQLQLTQQHGVVQPAVVHDEARDEFNSLGISEMYDRVIAAEKALQAEQAKTKEQELYLNRILKDIENKAPLIAQQRREHKRVLEAYQHVTSKLDALINENTSLKKHSQELEVELKNTLQNMNAVEEQNKDLCQQLQHILKQQLSVQHGNALTNPQDVISEHLVTYSDVEELQARNAQLLKVIRKLSSEQEQSSGEDKAMLQTAMQELQSMKTARQRMEDMVAQLIQQRDIYKAMAEDIEPTAAKSVPMIMNSAEMEEKDAKIEELRLEISKLKEHNSRLQHIESSMHDSHTQAQTEVHELRTQLAVITADAKYNSDRVLRLEDMLRSSQLSYEQMVTRKMEIETLLVSQQKECKSKEEQLLQLRDEFRALTEKVRHAEMQMEIAKTNESRLLTQLNDTREEMKRQIALSESVARIEAGLASRVESEKETLVAENTRLTTLVEKLRKDNKEDMMMFEQRNKANEEELRLLHVSLETKTNEISHLREEFLREQSVSKVAQERSAILEKQLSIAQERLSAIQGVHTMDSIVAADAAQREQELENALREVETLKSQLAVAEGHVEQYRKISTTTENMLKTLRQKTDEMRSAWASEKEDMSAEIERLKEEQLEKRNGYREMVQEIESLREANAAGNKAYEERLRAMEAELESSREVLAKCNEQMETYSTDVAKYQQIAKEANINYERELQLHAKVSTELQQSEATVESLRKEVECLKTKNADLASTLISRQQAYQEEKQQLQTQYASLTEDQKALRHTNDMLHSQVQSLNQQMSRLHESRIHQLDTESADQEATELTKQTIELREVIKYMKREKDILDAKLNVAENEKSRYVAMYTNTQKLYDETKAELQRELSRSSSVRSNEEFQTLLQQVTQMNILRESNEHLRLEKEELLKEKHKLQENVASLNNEMNPLKEKIIKLESMISSLETDKQSLVTDANYWKDRLHQLVSRYNDVDPETHRIVKAQLEEKETAFATLVNEKAALEEELSSLKAQLTAKEEEVVSMRTTAENMDKHSEGLRARLREFTRKNKEMAQQVTVLTNAAKEHESSFGQMKQQVEEYRQRAEAAESAAQASAAQAVSTAITPAKPLSAAAPAFAPAPAVVSPTSPAISTPAIPPVAAVAEAVIAPEEVSKDAEPISRKRSAPEPDTEEAQSSETPSPEDAVKLQNKLRDEALKRMADKKARMAKAVSEASASSSSASAAAATQVVSAAEATTVEPEAPAPETTPTERAPKKTKIDPSQVVCRFHLTPSGCTRGAKCKFLHPEKPAEAPPSSEAPETEEATEGQESDSMEEQVTVEEDTEKEDATASSPAPVSESPMAPEAPAAEAEAPAATAAPEAPKNIFKLTSQPASVFGRPDKPKESSPFINLKPSSPANTSTLQFGKSSIFSLPVPSGASTSSATTGATPVKSVFGSTGSLFGTPAKPAPTPAITHEVAPKADVEQEQSSEPAPAVPISTTVALTAEERRNLRMQKFAGITPAVTRKAPAKAPDCEKVYYTYVFLFGNGNMFSEN